MDNFYSYFHPDAIIKLLCKYRLKYTRQKHKVQLLADISSNKKTIKNFKEVGNIPIELSRMLPPRRTWLRPDPQSRARFKDSKKLQEYSIRKTILTTHIKAKNESFNKPEWYEELSQFIEKVHLRIRNIESNRIKSPIPKAIKKENTKLCKECRPISLYTIEDRVIISLTAKYFTELFDCCFLDSSYAFRAVKLVDGKHTALTHHDTISKILEFKELHKKEKIYVAECDIQKFFDCVNHKLTLRQLKKIANENGLIINSDALLIFEDYLKSYSFSQSIFPLNETTFFKKLKMPGCKFKWVLNDLKKDFYVSPKYSKTLDNASIGVPQGGALSCFISNLILHTVDKRVLDKSDPNLLYLRFCDDMILLHTNKAKCQNALKRYQSGINKLKLVIHKPQFITTYSKEFWKEKSKSPYQWAPKSKLIPNVPWLSFVGYQIKHDGSVRIRKRSLEKELKKQEEECNEILNSLDFLNPMRLNKVSKKSRRQQLYALENRLISMSVGRVKLYEKDAQQSLCWTNGFKALNKNRTSVSQLKILDKNRTQNLYRVKKELSKLTMPTQNPDEEAIKNKKFFGAPYSYHYFLINLDKDSQKNNQT